MTDWDRRFAELAFMEAKKSADNGGLPIGSVLAKGERLIASGHNQRVQMGDPIAHGEMDCLRKAGRQQSYRGMTLYTSLSPCMMCSGTIVQFKIPRVVINDTKNFGGNEEFLRANGVEVIDLAHADSIALMARSFLKTPPCGARTSRSDARQTAGDLRQFGDCAGREMCGESGQERVFGSG